jgi:hypothetical protein
MITTLRRVRHDVSRRLVVLFINNKERKKDTQRAVVKRASLSFSLETTTTTTTLCRLSPPRDDDENCTERVRLSLSYTKRGSRSGDERNPKQKEQQSRSFLF